MPCARLGWSSRQLLSDVNIPYRIVYASEQVDIQTVRGGGKVVRCLLMVMLKTDHVKMLMVYCRRVVPLLGRA